MSFLCKDCFTIWFDSQTKSYRPRTFFKTKIIFIIFSGPFGMNEPILGCFEHTIWATPWENLFYAYANNKGADQPAHPRSLISTCIVPCLVSITPLVSITKISSLQLASVLEQAGLSLTWSKIPKTGFLVTRLILLSEASARGHEQCRIGAATWESQQNCVCICPV